MAAEIAQSRQEVLHVFEAEMQALKRFDRLKFNIIVTNIATDQESSSLAWLEGFRKNIVYLPDNFPICLLCEAVRAQWALPTNEVFSAVFSPSMDVLYGYKAYSRFDLAQYFRDIGYAGFPEKCLLLVTPSKQQDPVFYESLLNCGCSVILFSHQFDEQFLDLNVEKIRQYSFFSYAERTDNELIRVNNSEAFRLSLAAPHALQHVQDIKKLLTHHIDLLPALYYQALETRLEDRSVIEEALRSEALPLAIQAQCYELFYDFYPEKQKMRAFFFKHLEYRAHMPGKLLDSYWSVQDELQEITQGTLDERLASAEQAAKPKIEAAEAAAALAVAQAAQEAEAARAASDARAAAVRDREARELAAAIAAVEEAKRAEAARAASARAAAAGASAGTKPAFFRDPASEPHLGTDYVQYYLGARVRQDFGGHRRTEAPVLGQSYEQYLLTKFFVEDNREYCVAVLPSVETSSQHEGLNFNRIDHYLNCDGQGSDGMSHYLERFKGSFANINSTGEIDAKLENDINSIDSKDSDTLRFIKKVLIEIRQKSNDEADYHAHLSARIKEIQASNGRVDVFFELDKELDFFNSQVPQYCKILFPFNLGNFHWVSVEIKIHKVGMFYDCSVYLYDPMSEGGASMSAEHFSLVEYALNSRIKAYYPTANITVTNAPNPYSDRRQPLDNGIDCGIYAVCDIATRIQGMPLKPYRNTPQELRENMMSTLGEALETALREKDDLLAKALERCVKTNQQRLTTAYKAYRDVSVRSAFHPFG